MEKEGVIPILVGGLGNQMFCLCAGYILSKINNIPLYIHYKEKHKNHHNIYNNDYRETIFKEFGENIDLTEDQVKQKIPCYQLQTGSGFSKWTPPIIQNSTPLFFIENYYQYYPPLAKFEKEIRSLFLKGLEPFSKIARAKIKNPFESAFLHVRRGDYLKNPNLHYIQPLTYYKKATDILLEKNKQISKIFILSDDIQWVKDQELFNDPLYTIIYIENELLALAFMSECKSGAICANSTFSWWGAFLGAYENRSPIFVPQKWIAEPIIDLFPSEWIIL